MLFEAVTVRDASGQVREVLCPDQQLMPETIPEGAYIAATNGCPATHTVLSADGLPIGWVNAEYFEVGFYLPFRSGIGSETGDGMQE